MAFQRAFEAEGFAAAGGPGPWALAVSSEHPWVAVYVDEVGEAADDPEIQRPGPGSGTMYAGELLGWTLAARVSAEFPVVAYAVEDSMVERGRLFHGGCLVDVIIPDVRVDHGGRRSGDPALWSRVLGVPPGETLDAALDADRSRPGMLERALGFDLDLASTGYRWYDDGIAGDRFDELLAWNLAASRHGRRNWLRRLFGRPSAPESDPRFRIQDLPRARRDIAGAFHHSYWGRGLG